jgi:predicted signal transduction protein with EAL and GGDEF domain
MGLGIQERASVLVESVAAMSRRLGMCVLIEGVETAKQLRIIETLGTIAEAQGFLFSPPVPESSVFALLSDDDDDPPPAPAGLGVPYRRPDSPDASGAAAKIEFESGASALECFACSCA